MMNIDTARAAAERLVEMARLRGADAADAVYNADTATEVSVRLGALEDVGRSENVDLGLRVFVGRRSASVSTSDFSDSALDQLVERGIVMAREAPEDEWAGLAPEERLIRGPLPTLELDDDADVSAAALKERALAAEDAARAVAGVTNSEGGSASAWRSVVALATSHGFAGAYAMTKYGCSASVIAGEGAAMERDYAYHSARHLADVESAEAIGTRAGDRAVARLGPARVESGTMPVVFDPRVGGSLIGHLLGAISGQAIARRTSFLQDMLGETVFATDVMIEEDPHRARGLRSRPFDGEGLPTAPRRIIDAGVLKGWLLDSASARQLGMAPTGHAARGGPGAPGTSASNLWLAPGALSPAELMGGIRRGVYVTELIGMGVNGVTGDYSRGAAGFLIEDGAITRPVSEFTIAGSLKDMFRALTPANDLEHRYGIDVPTLVIAAMTVASG